MQQFADAGFAVARAVFNSFEIADVSAVLERDITTRSRAGARHLLRIPLVRELANDPRLIELAAGNLGARAIPFRATLFDKTAKANWLVAWHQDRALPLRRRVERDGWGPWSLKAGVICAHAPASALERVVALRVHLDDSADGNGPLRVLPGTHNRGVLTDEEIARLAHEVAERLRFA